MAKRWSMVRVTAGVGVLVALLVACGGGDGSADSVSDSVSTREVSADAVVLNRVALADVDPLGVGGTALTLLVPEGWSVQGGPVWRHDRANLATAEIVATSPDGLSQVELFPIFPQTWQDGGLFGFAIGDNYLGSTVRPPITDSLQFLEELVLPAHRQGLVYNVVNREPLAGPAAVMESAIPGSSAIAERILIEYPFDNVNLLEEFTVTLRFTPNPFLPGSMLWGPELLVAIRAPAPDYSASRPLLQTIAQSPVLDFEWYGRYQYVLNLSQENGLAAIRAAGRASAIISDLADDTFEIYRESYENTQATNDRLATEFSQVIREVETYRDPFAGGSIELPNGYNNVFGADDGSVILSNDPNFDPARLFPLRDWQLLERS